MQKFFLKIFNKKTLVFVFLSIFVFSGLLYVSQMVLAQYGGGNYGGGPATGTPTNVEQSLGEAPVQETAMKCDPKKDMPWYKAAVASIGDVMVWVAEKLAIITNGLSNWTMLNVNMWSITNKDSGNGAGAASAFLAGWVSTRDLANMLVVLGFVVVGIATALRLREYEAKKFLGPLIIVALLINFSGLLCGLIIDGSNLTMRDLLQRRATTGIGLSGSGSPGDYIISSVQEMENSVRCTALNADHLGTYMGNSAALAFTYIAIAFSFLYLAVMLFARYAILGILFVLSPLAFVFWAFPFPKAKELWGKWWSHFLTWAFMGVGLCFFLNLAAQIADRYSTELKGGDQVSYIFVILMVIVVGIIITGKSSPIGAAAVIGAVSATAGFAMGAVTHVGGGLGKVANRLSKGKVSDKVQEYSSKIGRGMENIGLRDRGATAQRAQGQMDETNKRIATMSEEAKTNVANGKGIGVTAKDRAAAIQDKIKNGKLNDLGGAQEQHAAISYAESYLGGRGINTSNLRGEAEKKNYLLAGFNPKKVAEAGGSVDKAVEAQLDANLPSMDHSQLRGIDSKHLTLSRVNKLGVEKLSAFRTGSAAQIRQLQGPSIRGAIATEGANLAYDKHMGKRIDEAKLSKLENMMKEIDGLT